jgi:hypothetical protein
MSMGALTLCNNHGAHPRPALEADKPICKCPGRDSLGQVVEHAADPEGFASITASSGGPEETKV